MTEQRTAEWFAQRRGRVTGSVAGAALGLSPLQKPEDVIRAMVREYHGAPSEFMGNPATDYGKQHERAAMLCFMRTTCLDVQEVGFIPYEDWSGASPDGLTSDGGVLELKVPFGLRKQAEPEFKPLSEQKHYHAQVQLEMLSTGREFAYFGQYRPPIGTPLDHDYCPEEISIERVELSRQWLDENLPKLREFYAWYLSELDNPAHLEPLRVSLESDEAIMLLDHIDELDQQMKAAKESRDDALARLVEMAGGKNALIAGRKLTLVQREGSISYAKVVKDHCPEVDLEQYRGKGSEGWRIS